MDKITHLIRGKASLIAFLYDVLVIPVAWLGAFWVRFNFETIPADAHRAAIDLLLPLLIVQIGAYRLVGMHRGMWRFASIPDLTRIFQAVSLACGLFFLVVFLVNRLEGVPRSVTLLYALLLIFLLGGARFMIRWLKSQPFWGADETGVQRVLIVGAGQSGESVIRDLKRGWTKQYRPVALVDDRKLVQGQELHGVRVVGTCQDIPEVVKTLGIQLIIIAIPSVGGRVMRHIVQLCEQTGCVVRMIPGLSDVVAGRLSIDALREVSLEDLLGREQVVLDRAGIAQEMQGKVILVSGGGGSIGSELCRQVAAFQPKQLVIVDHSEFLLFTIEQELRKTFPTLSVVPKLLDVRDEVAVRQVFTQLRPQRVLHAAAYKHVPLLETQARQAIGNNVLGTYTLARVAAEFEVEKFLLVSTDKAVHPTNIMGASKRAAELICQMLNEGTKTEFITVRFGNVLDSAGSVIPTFRRQIEEGGPLTVTHPDITRFFMMIPEAVQLILQALSLGQGGELFVLDMGEPIKIQFLAEQMIRLAGKKLGDDIDIQYIGLRPGEKLYEELFYQQESLTPTAHNKIFRAVSTPFTFEHVLKQLEQLQTLYAGGREDGALVRELKILVPELKS